jgi:hypothetical protein
VAKRLPSSRATVIALSGFMTLLITCGWVTGHFRRDILNYVHRTWAIEVQNWAGQAGVVVMFEPNEFRGEQGFRHSHSEPRSQIDVFGGVPVLFHFLNAFLDYRPRLFYRLVLPHWMLLTPWLALLGLALARRKKPRPPTACPACGYDLRASPTRCPECGTPTSPPHPP